MKYLALLFLISVGLISCGDDAPEVEFPKTFVPHEVVQVGFGLYEVTSGGLKEFSFSSKVDPNFSNDSLQKIMPYANMDFLDMPFLKELIFLDEEELEIVAEENGIIKDTIVKYSIGSGHIVSWFGQNVGYVDGDAFWFDGSVDAFIKHHPTFGRSIRGPGFDLIGVADHEQNRRELVSDSNLQPGDTLLYAPLEYRFKRQ